MLEVIAKVKCPYCGDSDEYYVRVAPKFIVCEKCEQAYVAALMGNEVEIYQRVKWEERGGLVPPLPCVLKVLSGAPSC